MSNSKTPAALAAELLSKTAKHADEVPGAGEGQPITNQQVLVACTTAVVVVIADLANAIRGYGNPVSDVAKTFERKSAE